MAEEVRGAIELNMRVVGDVPAGEAPTPPGAGGAPTVTRGGVGGVTGGPTLTEQKEHQRQSLGMMGDMRKFLGVIGLGASVVEIARHSKILSTTSNAMFSMLAAIFDLALMPFMPVIVKLLQGMAKVVEGWAYISQGLTMLINDFPGTMEKLAKVIADLFMLLWNDLKAILAKLPIVGGYFAPQPELLKGTRTAEMQAEGQAPTYVPPTGENVLERFFNWITDAANPYNRRVRDTGTVTSSPTINVYVDGKQAERVRIEEREMFGVEMNNTSWERR